MFSSLINYVYSYFTADTEQKASESISSYQMVEEPTSTPKNSPKSKQDNDFKVYRSRKSKKRNLPAEIKRIARK